MTAHELRGFRLAAVPALGGLLTLAMCVAGAAPLPGVAVAAMAPELLRDDFRALYAGLQEAHYDLFVHTPRAVYDREFERALAGLDRPLTPFEARLRFQEFVALGRVAHARIDPPTQSFVEFRETGGRMFPLEVRIRGGRVYVAQNLSGLDRPVAGDEITSLDGVPSRDWLDRLRRRVSADDDYLAETLVEPQFGFLLWLDRGAADSFRLGVRQADGSQAVVDVPARSRPEMRASAGKAPATLEIDPATREARVLPGGVAYLRPGVFMNVAEGGDPFDTKAFHAFIDDSFGKFLAAGAGRLLIDLRDNPGGDNSFSDHMIAWFADRKFRFSADFRVRVSPQTTASNASRLAASSAGDITRRYAEAYAAAPPGTILHFDIPYATPRPAPCFTGAVYVLVNRRSFSNAVSVAAIVQDYGFGRVVGEPTADLATTLGAMESFTLPRTGFTVGYPKAHIIRPNGDERFLGVVPDTRIEYPLLEGPDDPVLQEALRIVAR